MQQPPEFIPDKEMGKIGESLWLYIVMQLTLSFMLSFIVMPIFMYSMYFDYSIINAFVTMLVSFVTGLIMVYFLSSTFKRQIKDLKFSFKPKETIDTISMMYLLN